MVAKKTGPKRSPSSRYQAKRNFAGTPEPSWPTEKKPNKQRQGHLFVVQKHAARRLHYDLRLEIEGALVSWAVPKGVPFESGTKHLAIKVEDHPLEYADFEGTIPPGNYGAGTVMVWDRGLYQVQEKEPAAALRKGRLSIVFAGEKLRGEWVLVRTRQTDDDKEQWLLFKGKDNDTTVSPEEDDRSAASGRTLAQIGGEDSPAGEAKPGKNRPAATGKKISHPGLKELPSKAPAFVSPMKPYISAGLPQHGNWIYEIKFDGYRVVAVKNRKRTTLYSRNHKDVSTDFPTIRDAIANLPVDSAVLDGEAVALRESGLSSFQLLQNRARSRGANAPPLFFYGFDLLNLEGRDTTGLPLQLRKKRLQELLADQPAPLRFSAGIDTDPESFLAQAKKMGLEGLIAKEADSHYQVGRRSRSWLKIKIHHQQEFVIGGYTPPKGGRSRFGSILIGYYEDKKLLYVGRVGTGFNERTLEEAYQTFQPLRTDKCPFANLPTPRKSSFNAGLTATEMKRCVWLKPKLVCQVKFSEWTDDDSIRHPVFLGFRDDKRPHEVKQEVPV